MNINILGIQRKRFTLGDYIPPGGVTVRPKQVKIPKEKNPFEKPDLDTVEELEVAKGVCVYVCVCMRWHKANIFDCMFLN